uniref:Uncharacterized protein n=1 Tax=Junco hyemalis TaxID=40217 RepID=A0A8C5IID2_JUNHY
MEDPSLLVLSLDSPVLAPPGGRGPEGVAAQVLHGGGANANSANRWWDKTLQATPPLPPPQRLRFSVGPELAAQVERAKKHLDR